MFLPVCGCQTNTQASNLTLVNWCLQTRSLWQCPVFTGQHHHHTGCVLADMAVLTVFHLEKLWIGNTDTTCNILLISYEKNINSLLRDYCRKFITTVYLKLQEESKRYKYNIRVQHCFFFTCIANK